MAELIEMDFWGWLIATILLIIWGVKAYRSSKGYWGKRDIKRCEEEQRKLDQWCAENMKDWKIDDSIKE